MKKCIKIAIIDSGFDFKSVLANKIVDYRSFCEGVQLDNYGHGTGVVRMIDGLCTNCEMYILKALDSEGKGDFRTIEAAIYYAIDKKVDMINASLGIESDRYTEEIHAIYNELFVRNIVFATTKANDNSRNYLYEHVKALKVVGGKSIRENKLYYREGVFFVMGMARMIPWLGNHYVLRGGNSFSLPFIIPYIIEAKQAGCGGLDDIYSYLKGSAVEADDVKPFYDYPIIEKEKVKDVHIFNIINDYIAKKGWKGYGNMLMSDVYGAYRAEQLLKDLASIFQFRLSYDEFQYPELYYVENLSNKIFQILHEGRRQ